MGAFNTAGTQTFYVRQLSSGINTMVVKAAIVMLQFWQTYL